MGSVSLFASAIPFPILPPVRVQEIYNFTLGLLSSLFLCLECSVLALLGVASANNGADLCNEEFV